MNASPRVFISYSHDSSGHIDRVLALSDRLRQDGIDCEIDQYEESPPQGWPRWMVQQLKQADFVLIVATEDYARRFDDREKRGTGRGAKWEGAIITTALYENEAQNAKFVPVVMHHNDLEHVPDVLRGATHYCLDSEDGYGRLYRRLTKQAGVPKPKLGKLVALSPRPRVGNDVVIEVDQRVLTADRAKVAQAPRHGGSRRDAKREELALLELADGTFTVLAHDRIERAADALSLHIRPIDSPGEVLLNSLGRNPRQQLSVVYGLRASSGRLRSIRSTREQGKEVWVLEVQEEQSPSFMLGEISYNGLSREEVAEAKARYVLLNEGLPSRMSAFGGIFEYDHRRITTPVAAFREIVRRYHGDSRRLTAVLRLSFVLRLWSMHVVAHVHRFDLRIKGDTLWINFEGQRPQQFSNVDPQMLRIDGHRPIIA